MIKSRADVQVQESTDDLRLKYAQNICKWLEGSLMLYVGMPQKDLLEILDGIKNMLLSLEFEYVDVVSKFTVTYGKVPIDIYVDDGTYSKNYTIYVKVL